MNICLFTSSFLPNVGGMENVVAVLAGEYVKQGHNVVVLAKTPRKMKTPPVFEYPVFYYKRSRSEVFFLGSPKRMLEKLHREFKFDVIHAHQMYPTGYLAVKFAQKHHVPAVLTSHNGDVRDNSKYRRSYFKCRRMIWAMHRADAVSGVGSGICQTIDRLLGKSRAVYIGNGCFPPSDPALSDNLKAIFDQHHITGEFDLSVCRLHPSKGLEYLIHARKLLRDRGVKLPVLVMAGYGQSQEQLQSLIAELKMEDDIKLIGRVTPEERDYLLRHCRLFMQPSLTEGMPLTVLESLSAGVPVVGTDIPGIREILQDKVNGRVVPPADAEALAAALQEITARDIELYGKNALEILESNSWSRIASEYIDLFEKIFENKKSSC